MSPHRRALGHNEDTANGSRMPYIKHGKPLRSVGRSLGEETNKNGQQNRVR